jgi:uncharacterized protein YjbJ (UPF0337 family)
MNRDRIYGNWKQVKGRVKERWGELTHDDFLIIAGRREQRVGKVLHHHGVAKELADKQLELWR